MTSVHERALIVDFGSQVTQLIARRLREQGVYCEVHPFHRVDQDFLENFSPKALILSGGPASLSDDNAPEAHPALFSYGVPLLGICYGEQLLCAHLGGGVEASEKREFGRAALEIVSPSPLWKHVAQEGETVSVWMSHGDKVTRLPRGFRVLGTSDHAPYAAIADEERGFYGVQFHPEVVHTVKGTQILKNFLFEIAGFKGDWTMAGFREEAIAKAQAHLGESHVICGLSGGVDSSVTAVLLHQAIGDRLTCVLVDTGLMRKGEADEVEHLFREHYHIPFIRRDASKLFLDGLQGVEDPERKRKIIGRLFVEVFEEEARRIDGAGFLAQGTLYPDVIESVSATGGPSVTIKSHHNVGGLPERMNLKLIEPLRDLFKDEVRVLGEELGLPSSFVHRHPFPGPGLAIRCPGAVTEEKLELLREADAVYLEEIHKAGLYDKIWQAFCVLLPVRTVGVMGDGRSYEYVLALRAVTSTDGMTADFYPFSMEFLGRAATRIINEVKGVNRVVYDVTSKPPGTIEWE